LFALHGMLQSRSSLYSCTEEMYRSVCNYMHNRMYYTEDTNRQFIKLYNYQFIIPVETITVTNTELQQGQ
jgi:hypothetical protein